MRTAETILNIIRERGQRGLPVEKVYRLLYNPNLYLRAYAKLNSNPGTMTPGATPETVDGMSLEKIKIIIEALRFERYRWTPVRRTGVPQGGVVSPILSNLVLDKLDKYIERELIPAHTRGQRRRVYPPYRELTKAASKARKAGKLAEARKLSQQAQSIPSRDPNDPNFRRLWYTRYADDFLLGVVGSQSEAVDIKQNIATFLCERLKLELSEEKTLITPARDKTAKFLGYEIHILHADDKHDHRGQRCINGSVGLRVPKSVIKDHCVKYMRSGKPIHLTQRVNDSAYSIVSQYQAEYRGLVQYYRMAYNLHTLSKLKRVMELSLVKTLAKKFKTTCQKIYQQYRTTIETKDGTYKVLQVTMERGSNQPLTAYFGGVSLRWNKWVKINDNLASQIWNGRSEVVNLQSQINNQQLILNLQSPLPSPRTERRGYNLQSLLCNLQSFDTGSTTAKGH